MLLSLFKPRDPYEFNWWEGLFDLTADVARYGLEVARENPGKTVAIAVGVGLGGAALCAGPIAAVVGSTGVLGTTASGTVIATLEGAALTSASLAALGGGSIAAGGAGMAGGVAVVSACGGLTAGASATLAVVG